MGAGAVKSWVLDTSALIRFYIPDGPMPDDLENAVQQALQGDALLIVPELAFVELGQVLLKKERAGLISGEDADTIRRSNLSIPLEIHGHRNILEDAVNVARKSGLTVYDAMFLALSRKHHAPLITADDKLKKVSITSEE